MKREHQRMLLGIKPKWKLVTESGGLVERFRTKATAQNMRLFYQKSYLEKLNVVEDLDG